METFQGQGTTEPICLPRCLAIGCRTTAPDREGCLKHHLLFYVPCYNLPRVHAILSRSPHAARMEVQPNYAAVLRLATAKPANEDRPGTLVSNVRRARTGVAVDNNQISSGF